MCYKVRDKYGVAMPGNTLNMPPVNPFYRCSGPNCGLIKNSSDRWWLMWTSSEEHNRPMLCLCRWDQDVALREGALPVCGEQCAQRLQSHFMGNVTQGELRKSGNGNS